MPPPRASSPAPGSRTPSAGAARDPLGHFASLLAQRGLGLGELAASANPGARGAYGCFRWDAGGSQQKKACESVSACGDRTPPILTRRGQPRLLPQLARVFSPHQLGLFPVAAVTGSRGHDTGTSFRGLLFGPQYQPPARGSFPKLAFTLGAVGWRAASSKSSPVTCLWNLRTLLRCNPFLPTSPPLLQHLPGLRSLAVSEPNCLPLGPPPGFRCPLPYCPSQLRNSEAMGVRRREVQDQCAGTVGFWVWLLTLKCDSRQLRSLILPVPCAPHMGKLMSKPPGSLPRHQRGVCTTHRNPRPCSSSKHDRDTPAPPARSPFHVLSRRLLTTLGTCHAIPGSLSVFE
ncbi:uncharacterized protein LOC125159387 [Prionailurus viverrinus]|uniref:uncharacterized protein LOC125159387 n=1 Tax=Prionailurus viverrinus TaxID=61388 RepID=UPI001FF6F827|nr:uncharacterized protein LOC125159387 [Prionailurus viverrinus]